MEQIEQIKQKIDLVELIGGFVPLKKAGRNFKGLCPFHSEKTPSFMVSPQLQIFKCFGCGIAGDAIEFLKQYERMDFWEAAEYLANKAGVKLKRTTLGPDEALRKRLYDLHAQAGEFYHFLLTSHLRGKVARDYLKSRGIGPKAIKAFKIGFSPLDPVGITQFLTKKGFQGQEMTQAGLALVSRYQPNQFLDRFRGRLIFPLHDHRGNSVGFSGRLIPGLLKNEDNLGKYINSPETLVYHKGKSLFGLWLTKEEIKKKNQALVVEGELDLISPWQMGVKNIVAIKGTAFAEDQIRLIKRFADKLVLALDEDVAGNQAALRGIQLAQSEGLEIQALDLKGRFKDPDEAAQKNPQFFKKAVSKPLPVWDYVIKTIIKKYQREKKELSIAEKKKILVETLPFLVNISNEVEKDYYLRKTAKLLVVSENAVLLEAEKVWQKTASSAAAFQIPVSLEKEPISLHRELIEGYLLGLILVLNKPQKYFKKEITSLFKTYRFLRIFKLAKKFARSNKNFKPGEFLSFLSAELKKPFVESFLKIQNQEVNQKEIKQTISTLKKLGLKEEMEKLSIELALAEKRQEEKKINSLERKFAALARELVAVRSQE
ncbi:DNA primase [Candidatus Shapirobacteria bacterium]|nr:DNA primase [Candidatus Shapirobacteria bacterium]